MTKADVEQSTIDYFAMIYPSTTIALSTDLSKDLGLSAQAKGFLYWPLWKRLKEQGCPASTVQSEVESAKTVGDVAAAFFKGM